MVSSVSYNLSRSLHMASLVGRGVKLFCVLLSRFHDSVLQPFPFLPRVSVHNETLCFLVFVKQNKGAMHVPQSQSHMKLQAPYSTHGPWAQ